MYEPRVRDVYEMTLPELRQVINTYLGVEWVGALEWDSDDGIDFHVIPMRWDYQFHTVTENDGTYGALLRLVAHGVLPAGRYMIIDEDMYYAKRS